MSYLRSVRLWLYGLVSTAISAAAGATTLMAIDPKTFNFGTGLKPLLEVAGALALVAILNFLQKHPLPELTDDVADEPHVGV